MGFAEGCRVLEKHQAQAPENVHSTDLHLPDQLFASLDNPVLHNPDNPSSASSFIILKHEQCPLHSPPDLL